MSDIFDDRNMRYVLGKCIPEGETLSAGVHGITLQVNRNKLSRFDVYVGITEYYLLVAECEDRRGLNKFYQIPELRRNTDEEIGTCLPLAQIRRCEIKNSILGAVNCAITLTDGSFLKLQLPKLGGLGGGMPNHAEYREKIIARLNSLGRS